MNTGVISLQNILDPAGYFASESRQSTKEILDSINIEGVESIEVKKTLFSTSVKITGDLSTEYWQFS